MSRLPPPEQHYMTRWGDKQNDIRRTHERSQHHIHHFIYNIYTLVDKRYKSVHRCALSRGLGGGAALFELKINMIGNK